MTTFTNSFSKEVWHTKYRFGEDQNIDDTLLKVAKDLASIEKNNEHWEKEFYDVLSDFQFVPGGRILSNAGTGLQGTSYINCFTDKFIGKDQDSIEGIYDTLKRQAQILKSEGGYGFCCSVMRPCGAYIGGIGNQSPGAVAFLELWDKSADIITRGGNSKKSKNEKIAIRKGAQMVTIHDWHPDVIEFIKAKNTPGKLNKFNMSVCVSDSLMAAVEKNTNWVLMFPDYEKYPKEYKDNWNGNIDEWAKLIGKTGEWKTEAVEVGKSIGGFKVYGIIPGRELWDCIMESTYRRNDPGVVMIDTVNRMNNLWYCEHIETPNPCQPGWAKLLTPSGIKELKNINIGDSIWSKEGWTTVTNKYNNGIKNVYKYVTSAGTFYGTEEHKVVINNDGEKACIKNAKTIEIIEGPYNITNQPLDKQAIMDGLVIGDGSIHKHSNNLIGLHIGKNDQDYFFSEINDLIIKHRPGISPTFYEIKTTILPKELDLIHKRKIPERFIFSDNNIKRSFLRGIYSANGSVVGNRITLKSSSFSIIEVVQLILSSLGIKSYYTTNKPSKAKFKNGTFNCKQSYDLNISTDREKFIELIGFIQNYKNKKIKIVNSSRIKSVYDIVNIEKISEEEVYDITVDNKSHTYWTQGCNVSNCGEQYLDRGICDLGSFNLTQYIKDGNWDYDKLKKHIPIAIRILDNVLDKTKFPIKHYYKEARNKRRVGIGVFGYASALIMMKKRYGSKEALKLTEELMRFIVNEEYRQSALLAKEKGAFRLFDKEKFLQSNFVRSVIEPDVVELIKKYGIRNSHLSSCQPNGNTSVLANLISSGIEPLFSFGYFRTAIQNEIPEGLGLPEEIDWTNKRFKSETDWKWIKEGDESLLLTEFGGETYKFDRNRGLTKEEWVEDYAVTELKKTNEWNENDNWAVNTFNLTIEDHVNTMEIFAKYVDSSISKTINVPNNIPYEDFKEIYMKAWKAGIKGFTTYREGTMANVLSTKSSNVNIERPREILCDVHHTTVKGQPYLVLVGLVENSPYEVFCCKNGFMDNKVKTGTIIKMKRPRQYKAVFEDESELAPITALSTNEEEALTRLISIAIQNGTPLEKVITQLDKSKGDIYSSSKAIARVLSKYAKEQDCGEQCPECGKNLIMQEGCKKCIECPYSKCG